MKKIPRFSLNFMQGECSSVFLTRLILDTSIYFSGYRMINQLETKNADYRKGSAKRSGKLENKELYQDHRKNIFLSLPNRYQNFTMDGRRFVLNTRIKFHWMKLIGHLLGKQQSKTDNSVKKYRGKR